MPLQQLRGNDMQYCSPSGKVLRAVLPQLIFAFIVSCYFLLNGHPATVLCWSMALIMDSVPQ